MKYKLYTGTHRKGIEIDTRNPARRGFSPESAAQAGASVGLHEVLVGERRGLAAWLPKTKPLSELFRRP